MVADGVGRMLVAAVCALACAPATEPEGVRRIASVIVTPSTTQLVLGVTDSALLVAEARDSAGAPMGDVSFTWSSAASGVATVSPNGRVVAVAAGTAGIRATAGGVTGSANVTVTTDPGGGGGGATVLFSEGFEDGNWAARGWYDNGALVTTTTGARSGSRAFVGAFALGASNVVGLGGRVGFAPTNTIYIRYWVRYSSNWVGANGPNAHPHEFFFLTTENSAFQAPARTRLTMYVEHNYQAGGVPILGWQDGQNIDETRINQNLVGVTEQRAVAGCNGNPDGSPSSCYTVGSQYWNGKQVRAPGPRFLDTPGPGYKADWHMVEAYFQMNSIAGGVAQNDGIARYWFDGQLVIDVSNAQFRTGARPNQRFNQMLFAPYIGNGSPVAQTMWVDDLLLATARP